MADIIVLPPALASQIAAGEVVERPASALKELIENSIDANASRIDIEVEAGGIARLSVYDNGDGMNPANAQLCLERHATSKLRHIDELEVLRSLGFRGEALPSIASVSRFTLQTRDESSTGGTELSSSGGSPPSLTPVGMAVGTRIDVRDIFYNVPARRKFLRSSGTESKPRHSLVPTLVSVSSATAEKLANGYGLQTARNESERLCRRNCFDVPARRVR